MKGHNYPGKDDWLQLLGTPLLRAGSPPPHLSGGPPGMKKQRREFQIRRPEFYFAFTPAD